MKLIRADILQGTIFMGVALIVLVSFYFKKEEKPKESQKKTNK